MSTHTYSFYFIPGPSSVLSFLLGVVVSSAPAVFSEIFLFFSDVGVFVLGFVFTSFLSRILNGRRICFSFFLPGVPLSPSSVVRSISFGAEEEEESAMVWSLTCWKRHPINAKCNKNFVKNLQSMYHFRVTAFVHLALKRFRPTAYHRRRLESLTDTR